MSEVDFSEKELQSLIEALTTGATPADLAGLDAGELEGVYALAYRFYSLGNYTDAETLFNGLCLYNYSDHRFWMGLAGCRQARGDFDGAIAAYDLAALTTALGDPAPLVYAGLCCLKKGDLEKGRGLLRASAEVGDPANPDHRALHEKAAAFLTAAA